MLRYLLFILGINCLIACNRQIPKYNVYNGFILGEPVPANNKISLPDSSNVLVRNLKFGNSIIAYRNNYNGLEYLSYIERIQNHKILSNINVYFGSDFLGEEYDFNSMDKVHPIRSALLFENPDGKTSALSRRFQGYLVQMLSEKYGEKYEKKDYTSQTYFDETFRPGFTITEYSWKKDYLIIKLIAVEDDWKFMRIQINYALSEEFFKDYKNEIEKINVTNSNF